MDDFKQLRNALRNEDDDLAEKLIHDNENKFGHNATFVNLKAQFFLQTDRPDVAIASIEPLLRTGGNCELLVTLGHAYADKRLLENAELCYQAAVECEPYLVSIIVPVYKVEPFLIRCLDSIAAQTYRRLEVILVDDGSPDHCGSMCDVYAKKDSRFTVVHQQNRGVAAARNAGLITASGAYIAFVDSDDWIEPNFIYDLLEKAIVYNLDVVECGFRIVGNGQSSFKGIISQGRFTINTFYECVAQRIETDINSIWNVLFRSHLFIGKAFKNKKIGQDLSLIYEVLRDAKYFGYLSFPLYNYYLNENSATHSAFNFSFLGAIDGYYRRTKLMKHISDALYVLSMQMLLRYLFNFLYKALLIPNADEGAKCEMALLTYAKKINLDLLPDKHEKNSERSLLIDFHVVDYFMKEKPSSLLIVGTHSTFYAKLLSRVFSIMGWVLRIDGVKINGDDADVDNVFSRVYLPETLAFPDKFGRYDCMLVTDILDFMELQSTCEILRGLLSHTDRSILCVTNLLQAEQLRGGQIRRYHPVVFQNFDFSYYLSSIRCGAIQFYTFYPAQKQVERGQVLPVLSTGSYSHKKLKIAYLLPHKNLTGGMKALLEQMRQMHRRGHIVYAIYRNGPGDEKNTSALPEWCDLDMQRDLDGQIVLKADESYKEVLPDVDVAMVGFVAQLAEFIQSASVPVVYWEQGYESLYGDYGKLLTSNDEMLQSMRWLYRAPVHYLAVSPLVSIILHNRFGLQADILSNGIDINFYHPAPNHIFTGTILLVGNPMLPFKGFAFAMQVLERVWKAGYRFHVKWACQIKPKIGNVDFPIEYFIMQSQVMLSKLYRQADVFLFTSLYESFPLPPFEAMASGVPVVAADCGGIKAYAVAGYNALLFDQMDLDSAAGAVITLLQNEKIRKTLAQNGRKTVEQYSFDQIAANLEQYFYHFIEDDDSCSSQ